MSDDPSSLQALAAALNHVGQQCRDVGLADAASRLVSVSRKLAPFVDAPPVPREMYPLRTNLCRKDFRLTESAK